MTVLKTRVGRNHFFEYTKEKITSRFGSILCLSKNVFTDAWGDYLFEMTEEGIRVTIKNENRIIGTFKNADEFDLWYYNILCEPLL